MEASDVGQSSATSTGLSPDTGVGSPHTTHLWMLSFSLCDNLFSLLRMVLMMIKLAGVSKWQVWDLNPDSLSLALYS